MVWLFVAGCLNSCNRHGSCVMVEGDYQCQCNDGWAGIDCSVRLEMECNDEIDNDQGIGFAGTVFNFTYGFWSFYFIIILSFICLRFEFKTHRFSLNQWRNL